MDGIVVATMRELCSEAVADAGGLEKTDWTRHLMGPMRWMFSLSDEEQDQQGLAPKGRGLILNHMAQSSAQLDAAFGALSDATRRGILERLGRGDASISELAGSFEMTLTGMKKHVQVLEDARLVTTEKLGRVRTCRLGPRRLEDVAAWVASYRRMLEARLDALGEFLERTKETQS